MVGAECLSVDGHRLPGQLQSCVKTALVGVKVGKTLQHLGPVRVKLADRLIVDVQRVLERFPGTRVIAACVQHSAKHQAARGDGGVGPVVDLAIRVQ